MNKYFHTPNSNSCMRSTRSIPNRLNPSRESFCEKAFCDQISVLLWLYAVRPELTNVGTSDSSFKIRSTAGLLTAYCLS